MAGGYMLLVFLAIVQKEIDCAAVFDANRCSNGCRVAQDCPANAHCVAVTSSSDCGLCLCQAGYRTVGSDCVPNDGNGSSGNGNNGNGGSSSESQGTVPTGVPATAMTTVPTTVTSPGTTTQGPPPAPQPLTCSDYACSPLIQNSDSDNPFTVRAQIFNEQSNCKRKLNIPGRPCKMNGGGVCYGTYCLTVDTGNDYCICDFYRIDRQCAVDKPGNCEAGNGQLPSGGYKVQNKRFRHKYNADNGGIYGRHFSTNMNDCVKLCQWSNGACRSVNFGTLAGQQVCELLSVAVTRGSPIEGWLANAPGWQHAQVVPNGALGL